MPRITKYCQHVQIFETLFKFGYNMSSLLLAKFCSFVVAVNLASGNVVGHVNEVTLRRAGLVLRWVTVRGIPSCYLF